MAGISNAIIIIKQISMMFCLVLVGYLMFRSNKISSEGSKAFANILIYLSLPCVIIRGFMIEKTALNTKGIFISACISLIVLLLSVLIAKLFMKQDGVGNFAAAFSNPGFFGVPLITACLGQNAVFYIAAFIAFLNIMQWSYGVYAMTGNRGQISVKKILQAPFMIAILIGLLLYATEIQLPGILNQSVSLIADLNTPIAMFAIGIYLAQTEITELFRQKALYKICFIRLLVIPILVLLLLVLLPIGMTDLKLSILIASACPVGANVAVYAQLYNSNYRYAVSSVILSTALSVLSMPLLIQAGTMLFH